MLGFVILFVVVSKQLLESATSVRIVMIYTFLYFCFSPPDFTIFYFSGGENIIRFL